MFRRQTDLLSLISNPKGTSRIELARATGGSPAKIGKIVHQLLEAGILSEEEPIETSRGRRPILLKPSRELGYLLGIDIGLVNLRVLITDLQGTILTSSQIPSSHARVEIDSAVRTILAVSDSVLAQSGLPREKLLAVGVSHSGAIDVHSGSCLYWHLAMQWKGVPLKKIFQDHYQVTCEVDDAVHCMAHAEKAYGLAQAADTFTLINVGQSISAALFLEGELFRGATGIAGELGHTIILPEGPRCYCGNRGCLEILASGKSIIDKANTALKENVTTVLRDVAPADSTGISMEAVCRTAAAGDRLAGRLIKEAGGFIGLAVANMINLLNPPLIILSGGMAAAAGNLLLDAVVREAGVHAFEIAFSGTTIAVSPLDRLNAARGAALRATRPALKAFWDRIFDSGQAA
ncbi:MAG: ROK family protein [Acidobacteria bacterium]|nr:ROK family protein [Acidobacteriota bacterium]